MVFPFGKMGVLEMAITSFVFIIVIVFFLLEKAITLRIPLETPRTITILWNWRVQVSPLIGPSLCREGLHSRFVIEQQPYISPQASLPFLSCCHRTTSNGTEQNSTILMSLEGICASFQVKCYMIVQTISFWTWSKKNSVWFTIKQQNFGMIIFLSTWKGTHS